MSAGPVRLERDGVLAVGLELANERTPEIAGDLFATEDLQSAARSFLTEGPGRASSNGC